MLATARRCRRLFPFPFPSRSPQNATRLYTLLKSPDIAHVGGRGTLPPRMSRHSWRHSVAVLLVFCNQIARWSSSSVVVVVFVIYKAPFNEVQSGTAAQQCRDKVQNVMYLKQAVRVATQHAPAPLLPRGHRTDGNVAAVSHGQHVPTPTATAAWRANTAVSKAAWWPSPLTLKVSHVWRGLFLCQFWSS